MMLFALKVGITVCVALWAYAGFRYVMDET
jgi:hypothetical protein